MEDPLTFQCADLNKVCRICLIKQEKMQFVSQRVAEMLTECIAVELPPEDFLICQLCEDEVKKWHSFKQQVHKAFEITKTLSHNITSKSIEQLVKKECPDLDITDEELPNFKTHKCPTCGEGFTTHGQLRTHLVTHRIEEGYKCKNCAKNFRSARSLWGHKRRHCQIKPFPCSNCEKIFPFKHALDRHFQARHSSKASFYCPQCPKTYRVRETLTAHIKKNHSEKSSKAVCNMCGKMCVSESNLTVHLRSHTGERPFICEFCSKGFMTKDHLTLHQRIHTGERPFVCGECGKGYISSSVLHKHRRAHTGERPYKCHLCPKTFALNSAYKTHLKSH